MRYRSLTVTVLALIVGILPPTVACGQDSGRPAAQQPNAEQLKALDEALRAGVISKAEYDQKRLVLTKGTNPGAPAAQHGTAGGSGFYRMRLVRILDKEGWGQPVEVAHFLIPSDWRFEGGAHWVQGMTRCPANIIQVSFRASSPDGLTGMELLPSYVWAWSDDPMMQQTISQSAANQLGCDANPVMSPMDFLARMAVPHIHQGGRVSRGGPLPQVSRAQQEKLNAAYGQMIQAGLLRGVRADAGRVLVNYGINGQPVEEWMSATVTTIAAPSANTAALMNGGMAMTANSFTLMASDVYGVHAPRGQLDQKAKLFATIIASVRPNPAYAAAVGQFLSNMQRINNQGAMDRQRIWREAQQSISNSINQTYQENQAVQDRMAEQFGQTIRGVEAYVDPRTNEKVELTAGYSTAWSNGKGEYILSDSPLFNPSVELHEDWTEMKQAQR